MSEITSIEQFKNLSTTTIKLSPFPGSDENLYVRVKATSILKLFVGDQIPNALLDTVTKLFSGGAQTSDASESVEKAMQDKDELMKDPQQMKDMIKLMELFAKEALVEPTYDQISDYLTDEQLEDIFSFATGDLNDLQSFRKEPRNAERVGDSSTIPPLA